MVQPTRSKCQPRVPETLMVEKRPDNSRKVLGGSGLNSLLEESLLLEANNSGMPRSFPQPCGWTQAHLGATL